MPYKLYRQITYHAGHKGSMLLVLVSLSLLPACIPRASCRKADCWDTRKHASDRDPSRGCVPRRWRGSKCCLGSNVRLSHKDRLPCLPSILTFADILLRDLRWPRSAVCLCWIKGELLRWHKRASFAFVVVRVASAGKKGCK